ncbi:MAG: protein phosphatase 2C domain-containing protein [Chloroflexota bacterium]
MDEFEIAGGSVIGREHHRMHGNCQDAYYLEQLDTCFVAVVCDGCSSSPYSEVGARLAARFLACRIASLASSSPEITPVESFLEEARLNLLDFLHATALTLGAAVEQVVHDYFLFTVVGVLTTQSEALFFSMGDGIFAVNGNVMQIGPFPDNAPPYVGYGLLGEHFSGRQLSFVIHCRMPTAHLDSFAIGTDGAVDLIAAEGQTVPGSDKQVPPLREFWREDIYFTNPAALTNRLCLINTDVITIDWQAHRRVTQCGRLRDDTTLFVGRRVESIDVSDCEMAVSLHDAQPLEA